MASTYTRRVTTRGAQSGNAWGVAWGSGSANAWGSAFSVETLDAKPNSINTPRVSGSPIGNWTHLTSRLSGLLALEGDMAPGTLLLEGDMQSGTDSLKLEGDENIINITANHTKRVATPVDAAVAA